MADSYRNLAGNEGFHYRGNQWKSVTQLFLTKRSLIARRYKYQITFSVDGISVVSGSIAQHDLRDVIRQEYADHLLNIIKRIPERNEFVQLRGTNNFSVSNVAQYSNYGNTFIIGNPAQLAQDVRNNYNTRILDDQWAKDISLGTSGLNPKDPIILPGNAVDLINYKLNTIPCNRLDLYPYCDDYVDGQKILAGSNGVAETEPNNNSRQSTDYSLILSSSWRNPERNEAIGSIAPGSIHQYGNAVDLVPQMYVLIPPFGGSDFMCILQTAGRAVQGVTLSFTEVGSVPRDCTLTSPLLPKHHIHVQR